MIDRHRTAIHRLEVSRPTRLALADGLIGDQTSFFDYGCGRGDDIRLLHSRGIDADGWDPVYRPLAETKRASVVNLGYVINVIENPEERAQVLVKAWDLAEQLLVVASRLRKEAALLVGSSHEDGCITCLNTFQKFYDQSELQSWIEGVLATPAVPAAPGVFYVFRSPEARESYLATKYRRPRALPVQRKSDLLFEQHRELLQPFIQFLSNRGRLPELWELPEVEPIQEAFGSTKIALRVVAKVVGLSAWEDVRQGRMNDLLVYLALSHFRRRPQPSELPRDIQLDIRAFFRNYGRAAAEADRLLFSAGDVDLLDFAFHHTHVGKLTGNSLYVHQSAIGSLAPILRVFEGCGKALVGEVEDANILKLHRGRPVISYLAYPKFDSEAHPALATSLIVDLRSRQLEYRDYTDSANPPILHRKEDFVDSQYPLKDKFSALTRQEEKRHLYRDTTSIGTKQAWLRLLEARGLEIKGHRVYSKK